MTVTTLLVRQDDLATTRLRRQDATPLADGQVRVATDTLALTANTVTYAAFGEAMQYWKFWPSGEDGWGIVPCWGFGTVVQSLHPGVAVGERLYGYWPMGSQALLQPGRLTAAGFRDEAPHRAGLHALYNQLQRCAADPFWTAASEPVQALLRPLFTTSWLIDDFLADQDGFGTRRILLSSASSKTAWCTAALLAQRTGWEVVGLTAAARRGYCESLGCYHRVLAYEELDALDAATPLVYVDFAGNAGLRRRIHERFGDALRFSSAVGGTHVDQLGGGGGLPGPRPTLFFAPAQAAKRAKDWGGEALQQRLLDAWRALLAQLERADPPWLVPVWHRGADAAPAAWAQVMAGQGRPQDGHLLDLR
jgi:hypothetical protein